MQEGDIARRLNGKNVVITGGAGFIGSHLADACVAAGASVLIFDNLSESKQPHPAESVRFVRGDIADYEAVAQAVDGADFVLHHGAIASVPECSRLPKQAFNVNSDAFVNVLEALRVAGSKATAVFASSAAVYGRTAAPTLFRQDATPQPYSVYGMSKLSGEMAARSYRDVYGIDVRVLRYANIFGPRQPRYIMFDMYNKVRAAADCIEVIGSGKQERDFLYIDDAVRYTLALLTVSEPLGVPLNIGSGIATSVLDVARTVAKAMNREDLRLECTGSSWQGDVDYLLCDTKSAHALAGPPKVSLLEGVERFVRWMKARDHQPA